MITKAYSTANSEKSKIRFFASAHAVADYLNRSPGQVRKCLKELCKAGFLTMHRRGKFRPNEYQVVTHVERSAQNPGLCVEKFSFPYTEQGDPLRLGTLEHIGWPSMFSGRSDQIHQKFEHIGRISRFPFRRSLGKVPVWPSCLMSNHILPAVKGANIYKHVSWHVFRGSYATLLSANGEDPKTVQDSLRHSTFQVTMGSYAQSIPAAVRLAPDKVVEKITATRYVN